LIITELSPPKKKNVLFSQLWGYVRRGDDTVTCYFFDRNNRLDADAC
jgi:hypothetical protein